MVKAFHQADIGVVLDVVYNHTCEGDHRGPIYSYKGIDAPAITCCLGPGQPIRQLLRHGNTLNFGRGTRPQDGDGQLALLETRNAHRRIPL